MHRRLLAEAEMALLDTEKSLALELSRDGRARDRYAGHVASTRAAIDAEASLRRAVGDADVAEAQAIVGGGAARERGAAAGAARQARMARAVARTEVRWGGGGGWGAARAPVLSAMTSSLSRRARPPPRQMAEADVHVRALEIIASRAHTHRAGEVQRGATTLAGARGALGAVTRTLAEGAAEEAALRERITGYQARLSERRAAADAAFARCEQVLLPFCAFLHW